MHRFALSSCGLVIAASTAGVGCAAGASSSSQVDRDELDPITATAANLAGIADLEQTSRAATITIRPARASLELSGTNSAFRIKINGFSFPLNTDSLTVNVTGRGSSVIDRHNNIDQRARTTLNVAGARATVENTGDDLATMNINDATTKLSAGGVSLFQGKGSVKLDGVGNTVVLGTGTFVDTEASAANTFLIGNGASKVNGVAQVAMPQNPNSLELGPNADLAFVTGRDGQTVTGIGTGTNLLATPTGVTFLTEPPAAVDWAELDGSLPAPDTDTPYALIDRGDGSFDFVDRAPASNVTIRGSNSAYEIVADGKSFNVTTDRLTIYVVADRAVVNDLHDNADELPRTFLFVNGADTTVAVDGDHFAVLGTKSGTTTLSAKGVGLVQGAGSAVNLGTLCAVLIGSGTVSDTADAFANTYLAGIGSLKIAGAATVAGVLRSGSIELAATATADIANAVQPALTTVTSQAPAGNANILTLPEGVRTISPGSLGPVTPWARYQPAGRAN